MKPELHGIVLRTWFLNFKMFLISMNINKYFTVRLAVIIKVIIIKKFFFYLLLIFIYLFILLNVNVL